MKTCHRQVEDWNIRDRINDLIDKKVEEMAQAVIDEDIDYEDLSALVKVIDRYCNMERAGFTEDEAKHAISMVQTLVMLLDLEARGEVVRRPDGTWVAKEFAD